MLFEFFRKGRPRVGLAARRPVLVAAVALRTAFLAVDALVNVVADLLVRDVAVAVEVEVRKDRREFLELGVFARFVFPREALERLLHLALRQIPITTLIEIIKMLLQRLGEGRARIVALALVAPAPRAAADALINIIADLLVGHVAVVVQIHVREDRRDLLELRIFSRLVLLAEGLESLLHFPFREVPVARLVEVVEVLLQRFREGHVLLRVAAAPDVLNELGKLVVGHVAVPIEVHVPEQIGELLELREPALLVLLRERDQCFFNFLFGQVVVATLVEVVEVLLEGLGEGLARVLVARVAFAAPGLLVPGVVPAAPLAVDALINILADLVVGHVVVSI
mmetsp:Transcript_11960/g.31445  ORF Transcript_11960/g.31445 Transcript_11960/m.31445 type:complete len:339 (-) Transcript_11960:989-2005(-)